MAAVAVENGETSQESKAAASNCIWYEFLPADGINDLVKHIAFIDIVSALAIGHLYYQKHKIARKFKNKDSVDHLYLFFLSGLMKLMVRLIASSHFIDFMIEKYSSPCQFFAFLESFFSVFEVEALTLACVERYVVAKYITYGWPNRKEFYSFYFNLCLMFAILYSNPLWFGMARFGHDFTCNTCSLTMVLPESTERNFIVTVFLLCTAKPWIFMLLMLFWAHRFESNFTDEMLKQADLNFTMVVGIVVLVNLTSWTPLVLLKGWILFGQFFYGEIVELPDFFLLKCSLLAHGFAPALTTLAMLAINKILPEKRNE